MKYSHAEITLIVPVYKVELYLRECLDSIKVQTYDDWECILVDDGSPDSCGKICDEYAAGDSRFRVIHRDNGGLAAARNTGLAEAKGRYISFVDSDDYVYPDFLKVMHSLIVENDADVVQVGTELLFTSFSRRKSYVGSTVCINREGVARELMLDIMVQSHVWNKLFRREVIDTPFPEGKAFEDVYAMTEWAKNIHNMVLSPEILYVYRQRKGSIVYSKYVDNRLDYLKMITHRAKVLRDLEPETVSEKLYGRCVWKGFVNAGKVIARNVEDKDERIDAVRRVSRIAASAPKPELCHLGLKKWIRACLLLRNPSYFVMLTRGFDGLNYQKQKKIAHRFS